MAEESKQQVQEAIDAFRSRHWMIASERINDACLAMADEIERLRAREAELLAQIESMRAGLDDALDKVRRRL